MTEIPTLSTYCTPPIHSTTYTPHTHSHTPGHQFENKVWRSIFVFAVFSLKLYEVIATIVIFRFNFIILIFVLASIFCVCDVDKPPIDFNRAIHRTKKKKKHFSVGVNSFQTIKTEVILNGGSVPLWIGSILSVFFGINATKLPCLTWDHVWLI